MAEPWVNPECTKMLDYAYNKGHSIAVYTTLVGMSESDWETIKDFNFEKFNIHLPDAHQNARITVTPKYISLLSRILSDGINGTNLELCSHGDIHPLIKKMVPSAPFIPHDRAGNVDGPGLFHQLKLGRIRCASSGTLLNRNVLLPDCSVLLCCMDYKMDWVLGNLKVQSYEEILQGEVAMSARKAMDTNDLPVICRHCNNAVKNVSGGFYVKVFSHIYRLLFPRKPI